MLERIDGINLTLPPWFPEPAAGWWNWEMAGGTGRWLKAAGVGADQLSNGGVYGDQVRLTWIQHTHTHTSTG